MTHRSRFRGRVGLSSACLAVLAAASDALGQAQPGKAEPLSVREAAAVRGLSDRMPIDLTPDGQMVAFTLSRSAADDRGREDGPAGYFGASGVPRAARLSTVMVAHAATGGVQEIAGGEGSSWNGVWSPDGQRLAFYWDSGGAAALWVWDRRSGARQRLSSELPRPYFGFETPVWSPDGARLLVKLLPEDLDLASAAKLLPQPIVPARNPGGEASRGQVTARVFSTNTPATATTADDRVVVDSAPSFFNAALADLAVIDARTGRAVRIARRQRVMGYRFSPDGGRIAYSTRQPYDSAGNVVWDAYHLHVVDTTGRTIARTRSMPRMEYGLNFSWSPDGTRLAWTDGDRLHTAPALDLARATSLVAAPPFSHEYQAPLWLDDRHLAYVTRDTAWKVPVGGGKPIVLHTGAGHRLAGAIASAGSSVLPRSRDGAWYVVTHEDRTKRMGIHRIGARDGTTVVLEADALLHTRELPYRADVSADGRTVAFTLESARSPEEIWIARDGVARQLTSLHLAITHRELSGTRLISWRTADDRSMQGALLLPSRYEQGRRYPLVVKVYGGSRLSNQLNLFGLESGVDNLHLLATRGYAVLLADAPARVGTPAADIAAAVVAGVDAAVATGIIDGDRVALLGHSYGGYSVLTIATRSDRFRAVVSSGGFSNLFSHYSEMRPDGTTVGVGWSERGQGRMGGSPWEVRDRYLENSPFFTLDQVSAPVLLLHGAADPTVKVARAEETFVALRRLGKEAILVRYEGEGHHPGSWSIANAEDYWQRIFDFMARHLTPASP